MARIIETATGAVEKTDVDPVTLDLIENGLRNARYEMDEVLFRTALSPGIREQHDEFPLIGDPDDPLYPGSPDAPTMAATYRVTPSRSTGIAGSGGSGPAPNSARSRLAA